MLGWQWWWHFVRRTMLCWYLDSLEPGNFDKEANFERTMMCWYLDSPEIEAELETVHSGVNVQVPFSLSSSLLPLFLLLLLLLLLIPPPLIIPSSFIFLSLHFPPPSSLYSLSPSFSLPLFLFSRSSLLLFFSSLLVLFTLFSLLTFSLTSGLPLLYRECQSKCCCEVRKIYFKIMLLVFILTNFEKRSRGWWVSVAQCSQLHLQPPFPQCPSLSLSEMRMDNDGTVKKHCHAGQNDETTRWYRDSLMLDSDNNYLREQRGSLHTFIVRCMKDLDYSIAIIYIFRKVKRENFGQYTCRYFQFYLPWFAFLES